MSFKPMRDKIFVSDLESGMRCTKGGIILQDDNMKTDGIRPRWAQVAHVGRDIDYVAVGDWVLLEHARWTNGFTVDGNDNKVWMIDPKGILLVSDSYPGDEEFKL